MMMIMMTMIMKTVKVSESGSDEETQAEASGSSQGGSSYAPSLEKRPKWPKITDDDTKKMYEYRYETKKLCHRVGIVL